MKKKSNNSFKALILMLVLTMFALIALSGTYAKYTSEVSGTGTAIVAKWDIDFKNGDTDLAATENFEIDLAKTMTSADSANTFIQPGSKGSFTITVTNNSQVPATVVASVSDESADIFSKGQFTLTIDGATTGEEIQPNATKDLKIDWEWAYSATDADTDDTTIGQASDGTTAQTICGITLSATQVDPNA